MEHLIHDTVDSAEQKGYERGRRAGRQEGREEIASQFVRWMVQRGYSDEEIQAVSPLSADEILKIKNGT